MDEQLEYDSTAGVYFSPTDNFQKEITGYYNMKGVRLSTPPHQGIYIIRYKDGTSKVVVRNR